MCSFTEILSNFLTDLRNCIMQELLENNPTYRELKLEKEKYYEQLQSVAPFALLSHYVEAQYAVASFEINHCYLRGWRYRKSTDIINPTSEDILRELYEYQKYGQLQTESSKQYLELKAILTPQHDALLDKYIKAWDEILGLEKHYCYSGAINDKARFNKYFNAANEDEWEKLTDIFL